jgi:uncharacterized peroxidase-related enzyme
MRLDRVANGHRFLQKVKIRVMGLIAGAPTPDVILTLMYRSEFFGKPYSRWLHEVMRAPSEWSVGERELFAAFTSSKNACQFCTVGHSAASSQALDNFDLVEAVLDDWRNAPVDPKLKAILGLLEKLTLAPNDLQVQDFDRVRATGLTEAAIEEAIRVCVLFNVINRLADAFDFDTASSSHQEMVSKGANALLRFGYRI